jgi:hypothetical protein
VERCLYGVLVLQKGKISSLKCASLDEMICFVLMMYKRCAGCSGSGPRYIVATAGFWNLDWVLSSLGITA